MKSVIGVLTFLFPALVFSQQIDTLSFFSETFNDQRTVYVHLPEDDLYKSEAVQFPVIYILDAQHEWFVNPVLNDISYLQYTHEIPKAIIIEVPLKNRNKECAIDDLQDELPLHVFLTTELEVEIQKYSAECLPAHDWPFVFCIIYPILLFERSRPLFCGNRSLSFG